MVLLQSHKQKRIPDTNRWIYTSLLKQKWISEATQWTYTNLHRRKQEMGYEMWKSTANLSGLRLTPQYAHRKSNATSQGLTMDPHIQEQEQQYDHRYANANLQGLIIATSHTNR